MKLITSVPRKPTQKRGRKKDITKLFYKIDHFIKKGDLIPTKPQYLRRFRDVAVVPELEINYEGISRVEKLMLKALSGFTGFFEHIIICNNFSYFDDLQEILEARDVSFKIRFLHDIIIFELSRIHIGIDNYTSYLNAIRFFQANYLKTVLHDPNYFPDLGIVSHAMRAIPLKALMQFYFELLEETYEFKIAKNRILIWDCQFVHLIVAIILIKKKGLITIQRRDFVSIKEKSTAWAIKFLPYMLIAVVVPFLSFVTCFQVIRTNSRFLRRHLRIFFHWV